MGLVPSGTFLKQRDQERPVVEARSLTTRTSATRSTGTNNRAKVPTRCESQVELPPRRSPGPYWLWAWKLCQDHNDINPTLKGHGSFLPFVFPWGLLLWRDFGSYNRCHKGTTWETFFTFAWANFSSLLAGQDRDFFVSLLFLLGHSSLLFGSRNDAQPSHFLTACRRKK